MMSTFNGNSIEESIKLSYHSGPEKIYVDPAARRLAGAALTFAIIAWLIHGGILTFRPVDWATDMVLMSSGLSLLACACTVGAMLERNIPATAWVAGALIFSYWVILAATAILRVLNSNIALPPFPLS
jgi:hypothetical protein